MHINKTLVIIINLIHDDDIVFGKGWIIVNLSQEQTLSKEEDAGGFGLRLVESHLENLNHANGKLSIELWYL